LSSLFRITDGIRMTTHEMLFLLDDGGRLPEDRTSAADLWEFAERHSLLMTDTGVCAGPRALIDEFLAIVCDGVPVAGVEDLVLPAEVQALLAELPAAIDYGLYALQVWTVVRSVWLSMGRAYDTIRGILDTAGDAEVCVRLRARLDADRVFLSRAQVATEAEREVQHRVHIDGYEQAWRALRSPVGAATLDARIEPGPAGPADAQVAARLRELLARRLVESALDGAALDGIAAALARYIREEQAILGAVTELEDTINRMLARPHPVRPLTARDCRIAYVLRDDHLAGFPYLFDALDEVLGIDVTCTRDSIEISDRRAAEAA
jgi:hypothetical protein